MHRRIATFLIACALLLGLGALAPAGHALDSLPLAGAAVSKSLASGGAGGSVGGAGHRLSELLSGWAVPVLIVLAGCLLIGALLSRNIGTAVGVVVVSLIGLIFLLSPQTIESLAKGIATTVF